MYLRNLLTAFLLTSALYSFAASALAETATLRCFGFTLSADKSFNKNDAIVVDLVVSSTAVVSAEVQFFHRGTGFSLKENDCDLLNPGESNEAKYFKFACGSDLSTSVIFLSPEIDPTYAFYQQIITKTQSWGRGIPKRAFVFYSTETKKFIAETYCFK